MKYFLIIQIIHDTDGYSKTQHSQKVLSLNNTSIQYVKHAGMARNGNAMCENEDNL